MVKHHWSWIIIYTHIFLFGHHCLEIFTEKIQQDVYYFISDHLKVMSTNENVCNVLPKSKKKEVIL